METQEKEFQLYNTWIYDFKQILTLDTMFLPIFVCQMCIFYNICFSNVHFLGYRRESKFKEGGGDRFILQGRWKKL